MLSKRGETQRREWLPGLTREPPLARVLFLPHEPEGDQLDCREQRLDKRTVRKRIKKAIEILREAEKDLP
jgi:hypothetical protein